ncbi:MAG: TetR/AcrR family transcriptional regulator [Solirubrobacterales bacterium]|nr:TetR/AcrR family transcriptional regulator [Solirubrobacterales bacterium]
MSTRRQPPPPAPARSGRRGPPAAPSPLSGRRAQAARNDQLILESARTVFLGDPGAPITAVAKHAGVGISALYTRYGSKEELLRTLCNDGLERFVDETQAALADDRDPWTVFSDYMRRAVDADTSSLTLALAGKFTPTAEMFALAERANGLSSRLFDRVKGVLRPGLEVHDISLVFELVAAVKFSDRARTEQLRRRYLAVILEGLRAPDGDPLPGPPPTWQEINERWAA